MHKKHSMSRKTALMKVYICFFIMHVCTNAITLINFSEETSSEDRLRRRSSMLQEINDLKRENARLRHALEQRNSPYLNNILSGLSF